MIGLYKNGWAEDSAAFQFDKLNLRKLQTTEYRLALPKFQVVKRKSVDVGNFDTIGHGMLVARNRPRSH